MTRGPEGEQQAVPEAFRPTLSAVVEAIRGGANALRVPIPSVAPVDAGTIEQIESYLRDYGETPTSLRDATWQTSVARGMGGHWDVVVDLHTEESGESDLVLAAQITEIDEGGHIVEVHGVYVP